MIIFAGLTKLTIGHADRARRSSVVISLLVFQIKVPSLKARFRHSATAISHTPTLVEVVLFGGIPEWSKDFKTAADYPQIDNTVVLRFGESTSCVCPSSHTCPLSAPTSWP